MGLHITAFPTEIIESMVQHLELADLCIFRLTCKALTEKSTYYFGRTYCTQASTNLSLASIQRLDAGSRSPLSEYVTGFWLRHDRDAGRGLRWDRDASQAIKKWYIIAWQYICPPYRHSNITKETPYKAVLPNLPVIQRMRDIILRFTNCRALFIESDDDTDRYGFSPRTDSLGSSDLIGLGFVLIAETGLPLEELNIDSGKDKRLPYHVVTTDMIHTEQMGRPTFKTALSNLKVLSLRLCPDPHQNPYIWPWDLVLCPDHLEKLKLQLCMGSRKIYFEPICLSRLQELDIEALDTYTTDLNEFLLACRDSLRSLRIHRSRLDRGWRSTFQLLPSFDKLESISIYLIGIDCYGHFPGLDDTVEVPGSSGRKLEPRKRAGVILGVDYSGPGTQTVLTTIAQVYEEPDWPGL